MGVHHVADRNLQLTTKGRRFILSACYVLGAALLAGALLWIGFSEDKSLAILLAIAALIAARILYVNVPEMLGEDQEQDDR